MATLQTHAEAHQEQIRVAEIVIEQLRANPTNPLPPFRAAFQKQVTEGGAFNAMTKYTRNHSQHHDWSFSARRVLTRADERFAGLLQWISGQIDEVNKSDKNDRPQLHRHGLAQLGTVRVIGHQDS